MLKFQHCHPQLDWGSSFIYSLDSRLRGNDRSLMITVPEATKKIIERSRFLSEAISKRLINYSSLARYIKPELEEMLIKKVSQGSIIMALKRLENDYNPKYNPQKILKNTPEMNIRSNLYLVNLSNNETAGLSLLISREALERSFYCQVKGIYETVFVISEDLYNHFKTTIDGKNPIIETQKVSVLTISLPDEAYKASGIYYFFLKSLAWEGINVLETVATIHEFSLVLNDSDIDRAFKIIKSLFAV